MKTIIYIFLGIVFCFCLFLEILARYYKQTHCNHNFKYKQNVWGHEGDVLMHQYECTKCRRKDYLIARDDPDKDWNHGHGDGKLCNIDRQEYVRN